MGDSSWLNCHKSCICDSSLVELPWKFHGWFIPGYKIAYIIYVGSCFHILFAYCSTHRIYDWINMPKYSHKIFTKTIVCSWNNENSDKLTQKSYIDTPIHERYICLIKNDRIVKETIFFVLFLSIFLKKIIWSSSKICAYTHIETFITTIHN